MDPRFSSSIKRAGGISNSIGDETDNGDEYDAI